MRKLKIEELGRISADEFHAAKKIPLVVVLDNIRSLLNVGSVFRTADAYRIEELILCGITATPPNAEIHKSALGAEYSVSWSHCDDTLDAVRRLHDEGYTVLSVEQATDSVMLNEFRPQPGCKYAVVLGNEVKGVQQSVIDASDGCLELPQYGTKHSLNVSVTAGIVIWEIAVSLIGSMGIS
ncbi:MAG: RNA methyltransferase [Candidatus Aphodosoma sp.]